MSMTKLWLRHGLILFLGIKGVLTKTTKTKNNDWGNLHGLILFLGIKGVCDDYERQKRKTITEACY